MKLDKNTTHLRIQTTHGKPFRRFGMVFDGNPADVPVKDLTDGQIAEFMREPRKIRNSRRANDVTVERMILHVEQINYNKPPKPAPKPRRVVRRSEKPAEKPAEKPSKS